MDEQSKTDANGAPVRSVVEDAARLGCWMSVVLSLLIMTIAIFFFFFLGTLFA